MKLEDKIALGAYAFIPWIIYGFMYWFMTRIQWNEAFIVQNPLYSYQPWQIAAFTTGLMWLIVSPFVSLLLIRIVRDHNALDSSK